MADNLSHEHETFRNSNPPVLTFCISLIFNSSHLRSGQSRDLSHYKPIISLWGEILKLLILQHVGYNSTSDTSDIADIHYCHVSLPISILSLCDVTVDVT